MPSAPHFENLGLNAACFNAQSKGMVTGTQPFGAEAPLSKNTLETGHSGVLGLFYSHSNCEGTLLRPHLQLACLLATGLGAVSQGYKPWFPLGPQALRHD